MVIVLPSQPTDNGRIIEWFKTIGNKFTQGIYQIITRTATTGSIVVYIKVSVSESSHQHMKMFDAVTSYVKEAFDRNRIVPKTAIAIMIFFDDSTLDK